MCVCVGGWWGWWGGGTYLEEGSCLAHCDWDFLTAASLQTEVGEGRVLASTETAAYLHHDARRRRQPGTYITNICTLAENVLVCSAKGQEEEAGG